MIGWIFGCVSSRHCLPTRSALRLARTTWRRLEIGQVLRWHGMCRVEARARCGGFFLDDRSIDDATGWTSKMALNLNLSLCDRSSVGAYVWRKSLIADFWIWRGSHVNRQVKWNDLKLGSVRFFIWGSFDGRQVCISSFQLGKNRSNLSSFWEN